VISAGAIAVGTGRAEVEEVDGLNVYWAAMEGRRRAVEALPRTPAHILVDGKRRIAGCRVPQTAVVDGDALTASIAAASIVAKVTRDSIMQGYAHMYPEFGFERHKGYGTADHIGALIALGPSPLHRWHLRQYGERAGHNRSLHCGNHSARRERSSTGAPRLRVELAQARSRTVDHNSSLQIKYRRGGLDRFVKGIRHR
jgi:ribonuclease HII